MKLAKTILIASLISLTGVSQASPRHGHHGHHAHYHRHHSHGNWVAPLVIGGVVGYVLAQPRPVIQQPPVQYPTAPIGYRYEQILDANCNCYRIVLVQNQ